MTNQTTFEMRILGNDESVTQVASALQGNLEAIYIRNLPAIETFEMQLEGSCEGSMKQTLRDPNRETGTLEDLSRRFHVSLEAYSKDSKDGDRQEHLFVVDGQVIVDRQAAHLPDDRSNRYTLTNGLALDYEFMRDMQPLRDGKVDIAQQSDGSLSFFFADTTINGQAQLFGQGVDKGFSLTDLEGDQVAYGSWDDLDKEQLQLYAMEIGKLVPVERVEEALDVGHSSWCQIPLEDIVKEAKEKATEKNVERQGREIPAKERKPPEIER